MFIRETVIGKDTINYNSHYGISPHETITPLFFNNVNHWLVALTLFPDYITELPIDDNDTKFNQEEYDNFLKKFINSADYIILKHQLALAVVEDLGGILLPIIHENIETVIQYKNGNTKIINSLIGKVLKNNKGLDPNTIRIELLKIVETM